MYKIMDYFVLIFLLYFIFFYFSGFTFVAYIHLVNCLQFIYTQCPGKSVYSILGITSSNTDRFSIFFHFYNLPEICNKAVIKYLISPTTRHYTTLWNTDVRK